MRKPKLTAADHWQLGYDQRGHETVEYAPLTYWRWGEWFIYMITTIGAAIITVLFLCGLTSYLNWATYHPTSAVGICFEKSDGSLHCSTQ